MRRALALLLLSACSAIPEAGAEEACRSIGEGWKAAALRCASEPSMPDQAICERAYSYDDDLLDGDCLPWMRTAPCPELDGPRFQAHCGKVMFFRTW